jgi:hypothetical protein
LAAPLVSALAALIRSVNPNLTVPQVQEIIVNTADKIDASRYPYDGNGWNTRLGYGRINAYAALKYTLENYGGILRGDITLTEDLTVPTGKTLTIEPGTTIKFDPGVQLTINGTLVAEGTSGNEVTFTRSGASGNWDYIEFKSSSSGTISNANIEYAQKGIFSTSDNVTLENCVIEHFTEQGIYASNSNINVEDCIIRNPNGASHGIYLTFYSNPSITGTEISGINGIGVYKSHYGNGTFSGGKIENCSTGFYAYNTTMEIQYEGFAVPEKKQ